MTQSVGSSAKRQITAYLQAGLRKIIIFFQIKKIGFFKFKSYFFI